MIWEGSDVQRLRLVLICLVLNHYRLYSMHLHCVPVIPLFSFRLLSIVFVIDIHLLYLALYILTLLVFFKLPLTFKFVSHKASSWIELYLLPGTGLASCLWGPGSDLAVVDSKWAMLIFFRKWLCLAVTHAVSVTDVFHIHKMAKIQHSFIAQPSHTHTLTCVWKLRPLSGWSLIRYPCSHIHSL